ncbi:hypothetical protein ES708_24113 [subsurface metagenome]
MKNISIDISGKIDSSYISAIKEIKKATDSQKISFFIIGAFARDIIMEYFYKIKVLRSGCFRIFLFCKKKAIIALLILVFISK